MDEINDKHLKYYGIVFLGNYKLIDDKEYLADFLKRISETGQKPAEVAEDLKFLEIKKYVDYELDNRPKICKKLLNNIYEAGKKAFYLKNEVYSSLQVNTTCSDVYISAKGGESIVSVDYSYVISTTTNGNVKTRKSTKDANIEYSLQEHLDWCTIDNYTGKIIISPNTTQLERVAVVKAVVQIENLRTESLCSIRQCPKSKKQKI